jgi:hypothetical protein
MNTAKSGFRRALVLFALTGIGMLAGYYSPGAKRAVAAPASASGEQCRPWGETCGFSPGRQCCPGLHCAFDGYVKWCRF